MYKQFFIVAITFVALQASLARPAEEKSQIDELAENARKIVQNVSAVIEGSFPDNKTITEALTKTSEDLATKVKSIVDNLNTQVNTHKGDVSDAVESFKNNLANTVEKLKTAFGPDAANKAKDFKKSLDDGLNDAIAEAQKLAKAVEPEATKVKTDLSNTAKSLLDKVVELSRNLKTELEKTTAQ